MPLYPFPNDDAPIAAEQLPGNSADLSWHNVQRQRLKKFAGQYMTQGLAAVPALRSQGETDTSQAIVRDSRLGFHELRVRLPVLSQYYQYTTQHGGSGDPDVLKKIQTIILQWCTVNEPTGKPIDETNFEMLLQGIRRYFDTFSGDEQMIITAWLERLRTAKEAWTFDRQNGEGVLLYGNHYTHHYKILALLYQALDEQSALSALRNTLQDFASENFPYQNNNITTPPKLYDYGAIAQPTTGGY